LSEHLTQNQLEGYSGRSLPPAELLIVSDHLSACEQCRLEVERALNAESAFFALQSEIFAETPEAVAPPGAQAHLSSGQISEYIEARISGEERQVIADHLGSCQLCALAVDDLRE
jgi:anti-sigma factor RsiW